MTKRSLDYPWLFINSEMLRFATTLTNSKLKNDKAGLAKAIFEISSSRFKSPKHSVRIFKVYRIEPSYKIWKAGGNMSSLKQSIVVKSMLLATGMFEDEDVQILRADTPYFTAIANGHYCLKVKLGNRSVFQDAWGREWKIAYGDRFTSRNSMTFTPIKVIGEWNKKHQTELCSLYLNCTS